MTKFLDCPPAHGSTESSHFSVHSLCPLTSHEDSNESNDSADNDDNSESFSEGDDFQVISALLPISTQRQRPQRRKSFPRIIKQDIRRYYGQMLINVLNSHDGRVIDDFLGRYALPTIVLTKRVEQSCISGLRKRSLLNHGNFPESLDIIVSGKEKISRYWQLLQSMEPDLCMRINGVNISRNVHHVADPHSGKVRVVIDDETKVVCEWEGRATQIYDVAPVCFAYTAIGGQFSGTSSNDAITSFSETSVSSEEESFPATKRQRMDESGSESTRSNLQLLHLQRRSVTFQASLRGRLVMEVDREFRLKKIDFGTVDITI